MGFLDSLKAMAIKAKCTIGMHGGDFRPIEGKPQCHAEKTCPDCGEHLTTFNHKYPPLQDAAYDKYGSCNKTLGCIHCGELKTFTQHAHFNFVGRNGNCMEIEKCSRCGHERANGQEMHNWNRKSSLPDGKIVYQCSDCQKEEVRNY